MSKIAIPRSEALADVARPSNLAGSEAFRCGQDHVPEADWQDFELQLLAAYAALKPQGAVSWA
ncbi:hypothetical protein D3880_12620 [Pseudomonas cavernae]|uniref:Uncharacterized protein n=1 Tax=Pseudomonas cavernae TaxID=2320867 RepID=A0A385Z6L3_9PSED|nr:hypothetical protein [Pseudomonas cavernae]AYC33142.1 hypothetical protein D3880_12620 [Pseudomonas cavernae]